MTQPNINSAASVARVISLRLRKAGFQPSRIIARSKWATVRSKGFVVQRSGKYAAISYWIDALPTPEKRAEVRQIIANIKQAVARFGYAITCDQAHSFAVEAKNP